MYSEESTTVGAVDLGSKNFKFVLGRLVDGRITTELVGKEPLQIGREVTGNHGTISPEKMRQIEAALSRFMQTCRDNGAATVLGIATSAIRNARNQQQIIDLALGMGLSLEIADGEREGRIGYLAATGGALGQMVSDCGSKSIQVAWESGGSIVSRSVSMGYELAYETFVQRAASVDETQRNFTRFLDGNFTLLPEKTGQLFALAANTLTAFADGEPATGQRSGKLTRTAMKKRIDELREFSPSRYDELKSSLPRAEKILPGLFFLDYLLEKTGHDEALIAKAELPVGLIVEHFLGRDRAGRSAPEPPAQPGHAPG